MPDKTERWSIIVNEDGELETLCPLCGARDSIYEVDRAIRWNTLYLERDDDGTVTATASTGDYDWEGLGWHCDACQNDNLDEPEGFQIDWY